MALQLPLIVSGVAFIAGAGVMAGAVDVGMLVAGRVLLGIGVGLASLVVPMFNAECAPAQWRGGMNIRTPPLAPCLPVCCAALRASCGVGRAIACVVIAQKIHWTGCSAAVHAWGCWADRNAACAVFQWFVTIGILIAGLVNFG